MGYVFFALQSHNLGVLWRYSPLEDSGSLPGALWLNLHTYTRFDPRSIGDQVRAPILYIVIYAQDLQRHHILTVQSEKPSSCLISEVSLRTLYPHWKLPFDKALAEGTQCWRRNRKHLLFHLDEIVKVQLGSLLTLYLISPPLFYLSTQKKKRPLHY